MLFDMKPIYFKVRVIYIAQSMDGLGITEVMVCDVIFS